MVFAADYPFMDVLWTMLIFFAFVVWIWMMVAILSDVFRRRDLSGWAKAAWTVFLVVLPWIGALVYLIANGADMPARSVREASVTQAEFDYVRSPSANGGPAEEIAKAKELLDGGAISQAEFDAIKAKVIA
jgi:Phospholipase_D-nuclease N-terminal/Short C-terminal domain